MTPDEVVRALGPIYDEQEKDRTRVTTFKEKYIQQDRRIKTIFQQNGKRK
ncbi:hypothetical protein [Veronia nyctiphanis]|nr:hypothetical protein [Veronia nyctiphanis]